MDELNHDEDATDEPIEEPKRVWGLAVGILAILAAVAFLFYVFVLRKPKPPEAAAPAAAPPAQAEAEKAPAAPGLEPLAFPAVSLAESDAAIRPFAGLLSTDPVFAKWVLSQDLIRTFVVSVDNVANGLSPKPHLGFFSPEGAFRVARAKTGTFVDPAGYARYAPVIEVVRSIDATAAVRLYRAVGPLVQEAYNELGYPGVAFDSTLEKAMGELLETPVVEGPIRLQAKVLSYTMADPALEGLSLAQKQLLRLGPKGVAAVQAKIREIAAVLGIPASRLPPPKTYTPAAK